MALLGVVAAPAGAETRLGVVSAGDVLRLRVDNLPPLSRILIRIDGDDYTDLALSVQGGWLLVPLPAGLDGVAHDLVVMQRRPDEDTALETFSFETPTGMTAYAISGTVEAGVMTGQTGRPVAFATGNSRISFELDRGRLTGGMTMARGLDLTTGLTTDSISDYFLERRMALWGDDLVLRLGSQYLDDDMPLFDGAARAGVSLRLNDVDNRYHLQGFVTQAGLWDAGRAAFGIADDADRVVGLRGGIYPFAGRGLKLTYAGFAGQVPELASGNPGRNEGWAGLLSLPFAADRGSLAVGFAQTTSDDGTETTGRATTAEVSLLATPLGQTQSLTFTARHERRDIDFFSALNPAQVADEVRSEFEAAWYAPQFQANLLLGTAMNNIANDPGTETDRFRDASLTLYYTPKDFTGGFWNGTSLHLALNSEDQRRLQSPAGAPAPSDNRFDSLTLGIDRFRAETSWALRYSHEQLKDLTGAGANQRAQRIEALYAYSVTDDISINLQGKLARVEKSGIRYHESDFAASLWKQLVPEKLSGEIGMGVYNTDLPGETSGRYANAELAWEFRPDKELVFVADYAEGSESHYLSPAGGWVVGLSYRQDFGLFKRN